MTLTSTKDSQSLSPTTLRGIAWLLAVATLLLPGVWLAPAQSISMGLAGYTAWHSLMEVFSIIVAMLIFAVAWNAYSSERPGNVLILACGFLAVGLIDLAHTNSYPGMPIFVTPAGTEKAINFWLAARLLAAGTLLAIALRRWSPIGTFTARCVLLAASLAVTALVYWVGLYHAELLPRTFVAGSGLTPFKVATEYFIIAVLGIAALFFLRHARRHASFSSLYLLAACWLSALSELCFSLYFDVADLFNLLGHLYKIAAYALIYRAVFVESVRSPFERLSHARGEIERANEEIRRVNAGLEQRVAERTATLDQASIRLRDAATRLKSIVNAVLDGIVSIDERGNVELFNSAAERIFGYAAVEVIGCNVKLLMPEPYRSQHDSHLDRRRTNAGAAVGFIEHEVLGRRKDGSIFPLELSVSEMRLGEERRVIAVLRDITERKRAETALRDSEENLAITLHSIADAVLATDLEGRVTRMNPVAERLTGWPVAEARGRPVGDVFRIINEQTRERAHLRASDVLATGEFQGIANHAVLIARDGTESSIADSAAPIRDAGGKVIGVVLVFRDVTAERQAERAIHEHSELLEQRVHERTAQLSESQARYRSYFDSSMDAQLLTAPDGSIIDVNAAACELLGRSAQELMQLHRSDLVDVNDPRLHASMQERARTGRARAELTMIRADGTRFPVDVASSIFTDAAGLQKTTMAIRDLTARKRAEQEIRDLNASLERRVAERTFELEQANHAKDSFLATMSHEIRTPLGGLLGMLELLSMSPLADEQAETLRMARESGRGLLRILNDILDWSKIREGKLEIAPQPTSIAELVADVANTYAHVASGHSVTLTQQVDSRLSPVLMVDPLRLSQVLNNFVSNAVKFSHRGGRVELRAELIRRRETGEEVRFSVKDTGIGIDTQTQSRLFQRFGQASIDTARMYGGTGLGLAICRRLADLMDARIDLTSEPGRGSTFGITLTLPLAPTEREARQAPAAMTAPAPVRPLVDGAAAKDAPLVLVVDDHLLNRKLLARQLGLLGLRAETAASGEEALLLWREGRHALVITDCHMAQLDGYELTSAIRRIEAEEGRARTPVFAWTANALPDEIERCAVAGMDELLVKPAELGKLKRMLEKWLPPAAPAGSTPADAPAPQDGAAPPPLDLAILTAMCGGDGAATRENLLLFRRVNDQDAEQLRRAVAQDDLERVSHAAHRMLGSSSMVRAEALARACQRVNHASRAGDSETVAEGMQALEGELQRLNTYIDSLANDSQGVPDALQ